MGLGAFTNTREPDLCGAAECVEHDGQLHCGEQLLQHDDRESERDGYEYELCQSGRARRGRSHKFASVHYGATGREERSEG